MKSIYYISVLLAALLTGCSFLDETVYSSVDEGDMYKTYEQADLAVAGIYANLSSNKGYNRLWQGLTTYGTDEARCLISGKLNDNFFRVSNFSHTASDTHISNLYLNIYNGIALCNDAADKIGRMDNLVTEDKDRLLSEVCFLRGFFYFNLVQLWGPVRLLTDAPEYSEIVGRNFKRASVEEVYGRIVKDLDMASGHLPSRMERSVPGRATAMSAKGLLAKVYLTMASGSRFGVDGYEDFDFMEYYGKARDMARLVIDNEEGYNILESYEDVFDWHNKYNDEILFDANFAIGVYGNQWPKMGGPEGPNKFPYYECGWSGRAYLRPTAYLSLCVFGHDKMALKEDGTMSSFSTSDVRFGTSIANFGISNSTGRPNGTLKANVSNWTAYKFNVREDKHDGYTWQATPMNHPILRFSDILLTYAEAGLMLDMNDTEAYKAWNRVRRRAKKEGTDPEYLKDLSGASFSSVHEMMDEMLDERMREFCFEGIRRFDLYRTSRFIYEYRRMEKRLGKLAEETGNEAFGQLLMECDIDGQGVRTNLKPFHVLFPIPQYEMNIASDPEYYQNPGWTGSYSSDAL